MQGGRSTPHHPPKAALRASTVGREAILSRLAEGARGLRSARPPLPLYLFGPSGIGKSHILSLLRQDLEQDGLQVQLIPEDIPGVATAEELLAYAQRDWSVPAWTRWGRGAALRELALAAPTVLLIEDLDARLRELGSGPAGQEQRQKLRGAWDQSRRLWVIGAGERLSAAFTDPEEPFFGWFDPEALGPLTAGEAGRMMEKLVPKEAIAEPDWLGQRDALVALAVGSPGTLAVLARSFSRSTEPLTASEALRESVRAAAAYCRARFRSLSRQAQHIVDLLALSPREMGPSEMARSLGWRETTVGTQARRLAEEGALKRREERGATWYSIADPLFRYWLESRFDPWERTRIALASSLAEARSPPEGGAFSGLAAALVEQIQEPSGGYLHPELAHLLAVSTSPKSASTSLATPRDY